MRWLANKLVLLIKKLTRTRPAPRVLSKHDQEFIEELRKRYWK